jgi:uncharacterized membrane protein YdjX (TVP38/TMEM64 family)
MTRRLLLVALVTVVVGAMVFILVPQGRAALVDGVGWLRSAGALGKLLAIGFVVVGIPLGLPTLWFAALLGYLFGVSVGVPLALVAIPAGAIVAFVTIRALLYDEVRKRLLPRPKAAAIIHAVGSGGGKLVALLRIAGPHNMLNAIFAASDVPLKPFAVGTLLGSIPSVGIASFGGALAPNAAALWDARDAVGNLWIPVAVVGVVAILWSIRAVKRAAQAELAKHSAEQAL